jgi:hypothetical protein
MMPSKTKLTFLARKMLASEQTSLPKIKVGTFPCNFEEEMVTDHTQQKAGQNNLP